MRNKFLMLLVAILCVSSAFAQNGVIPLNGSKTALKIKANTDEKLSVVFNHNQINSFSVDTKAGTFDEISISGAVFTNTYGDPKLPVYSKLIEVPQNAELKVKVKSYETEEYKLADFGIKNKIMPVQPSVRKDQDPAKLKFYYNEKAYKANRYSELPTAKIEVLGTMRGVRIARLTVSPVNYNPAKGMIKVYNNIEVDVNFENADTKATDELQRITYSPYFESVYHKLLNHKGVYEDHPDLVKFPVKMLVLADRKFETVLQPYIAWKTKKGFEMIVNYTDEGYNTVATIKQWIQNHYNAGTAEDPAPSFCLFVGDVAEIPASQEGLETERQTDLYYFSQDGDVFPEMYYGRFSASTVEDLQAQIDKTLYYEKYEFTDPTYLDNVTLIAGADGTWNPRVGQATVNYGTTNYFNNAHGFANINAYLDSYDGCYDADKITVSFLNYTAHCSETTWADPSFTISNVNSLTNEGKYPLAVGNCCMSADFGFPECIGEAWVRAENKGAVAYIGSSPSSYWFEDFYWSVGAFPVQGYNNGYVPTVDETTVGTYDAMFGEEYLTVDATIFVGNLSVSEVVAQGYPSSSGYISPMEYYWEAYNCLGDPSLITYKTQGSDNNVTHLPIIHIGVNTYDVNAEPGSYVAISKDGVLLGVGMTNADGEATVSITPVTEAGNVDIVVTKPQYKPYMATVPATAIDGPFMSVESYTNQVTYGQSIDLDLVLKNIGVDQATNVAVTISTDDPVATITNSTFTYGDVAADASTTSSGANALTLEVNNSVENEHKVPVTIAITSTENTWEVTKNVKVLAPELKIISMVVDDEGSATVNETLDPGETADIKITVKNTGAAAVDNIITSISTNSTDFTINNASVTEAGPLEADGELTFTFSATANDDVALGTITSLTANVTAGTDNQYTATKDFEFKIGIIPIYPISDGGTLTVCTGNFYDSGLESGNYMGSEDYTMTFIPPAGQENIAVNFLEFKTEKDYDKLYIHDGINTDAPQISGSPFSGEVSPGQISSSTGLTFHFTSDGSFQHAGWYAEVSCYSATEAPACPTNLSPSNEVENVFPTKLSWTNVLGAASYKVYLGTNPDPFTNEPIEVTEATLEQNFEINTQYYWAVVAVNSFGESEGCETWTFTTGAAQYIMENGAEITTCDGVFYDAGGPDEDYANDLDQVMTFKPGTAGKMISMNFTEFKVEEPWGTDPYDYLSIYDGTDVSANLIGTFYSTSGIPAELQPVTATNADGALTFKFHSDNSTVKAGWTAIISCAGEYTITFDVRGEADAPIVGANVNFNGTDILTNEDALAVFENCEEATEVPYTVTKEGYTQVEGTVNVDDDKEILVNMEPVSVNDIKSDLSIVPNPSNGIFTVNVKGLNTEKTVLEIYTVSGKLIMKRNMTSESLNIDLSEQAKGIYFIKLMSEKQVFNSKLIIE